MLALPAVAARVHGRGHVTVRACGTFLLALAAADWRPRPGPPGSWRARYAAMPAGPAVVSRSSTARSGTRPPSAMRRETGRSGTGSARDSLARAAIRAWFAGDVREAFPCGPGQGVAG